MTRMTTAAFCLFLLSTSVGCADEQEPPVTRTIAEMLGVHPVPPDFTLGEPAPCFELPNLIPSAASQPTDSLVKLASYRGNVVVLNFWATGCTPCVKEHDTLNEVALLYRGRGASFLGIMSDDSPAALLAFEERFGRTEYPNLYDQRRSVRRAYNVRGIPVHVVIDTAGRVAWWHAGGPISEETLSSVLDDVFAGRRPTAKTSAAYPSL